MCDGKEVPALPRGPQQPGKVPGAPPPPMGGPGGVPGFKKV